MKKSLVTFLICYTFFSLTAQIEPYDISTYVRPDLQRTVFNIQPDFRFTHQNNNNSGSQNDDKDLTMLGNLFVVQNKFVNSAKEQLYVVNAINFDVNYTKDDGYFYSNQFLSDPIDQLQNLSFYITRAGSFQNSEAKNAFFASPAYLRSFSKKKFLSPDQRFFELSYVGSFDVNYFRYKNVLEDKTVNELNTTIRVDVPVFWGKGRIEFVDDAWHAQTILEFLQDKGFLEKEVSAEEVEAFAQKISTIKNFRNTDFRLEEIAEYEALSKYLIDNGMINPTNYGVFPVLTDVWRREDFITRRSGKEFKYGIVPSIDFYDILSRSENDNYFLDYGIAASVAYNRFRPINNDWQTNWLNFLRFGPELSNDLTENNPVNTTLNGRLNSTYEVQFLQSVRTFYLLSLGVDYRYTHYLETEIDNVHSVSATLSGQYRYYFSPRLTLFMNGRLTFSKFSANNDFSRNFSDLTFGVVYNVY